MSPPTWGEVLTLLDQGKPKYGWKWMADEGGSWWEAREGTAEILQVQPSASGIPGAEVEPVRGALNTDAEARAADEGARGI